MSEHPKRGILVLAYGHKRYHRQAHTLALSLQRHSPGLHRTLATDDGNCPAAELYDDVIEVGGTQSDDCRQKLHLDRYAPYPYTLYLDADALAVRPVEPVFDLFDESDIGVVGRDITPAQENVWYGDVASMCRKASSTWLPKCNSGLMLIRPTETTRKVFGRARQLADGYQELGLHPFRRGIADEPLLAMALAESGIHAQDLTAVTSATPIGISGPLQLDVLNGDCAFDKNGMKVAPALIHFAADYSSDYRLAGAPYRRERSALRLAQRRHFTDTTARIIADLRYGLQCTAFNTWIRIAGRAPRDPSGVFDEPRRRTTSPMAISSTKQSPAQEETT
ncbi:hypothetical protein [Streptomyces albiflavescens]|uniref:hypothetical protein n=1 Tax=Streptomyces albiflavescens TaxID=1623582 RepID=UPI00166CE362|nr:hypothetical protein [Streptomyces albiflavescens]